MSWPLPPGGLVGVLGGGQLGRMLAMAAAKLGLRTHIYAPEADSPAFDASPRHTCAPYEDIAALRAFGAAVDVVTYEFENVPALSVAVLEELAPVYPPRRALAAAQDRLAERRLLQSLGLPHAPFRFVEKGAAAGAAHQALGGPAFLKKLREGYDGRGQFRIEGEHDLAAAADWLGDAPAILEAAVPFAFECSVIGARGADGAAVFYPLTRNEHRDGILRTSIAPAGTPALQEAAQDIAARIMAELGYVGVIGVELFALEGGALMVNEIAPRVHNSGHWTLEACAVSQFENHIRAVAGWPLGAPAQHSAAVMTNLIGDEVLSWRERLAAAGASLHLYGKGEPRAGRKMGHYTALAPLPQERRAPTTR
ncbi:MAG: 5-(carboxyamino)imidazole ribonucleotide synthase [Hyphomicrobiales bacterium]|nr:5-(carboxyamino)imidazole ribonucleotide synthase [Hyphomicrobiales bacterium]